MTLPLFVHNKFDYYSDNPIAPELASHETVTGINIADIEDSEQGDSESDSTSATEEREEKALYSLSTDWGNKDYEKSGLFMSDWVKAQMTQHTVGTNYLTRAVQYFVQAKTLLEKDLDSHLGEAKEVEFEVGTGSTNVQHGLSFLMTIPPRVR